MSHTHLVWRWPRNTTRRACFAVNPACRLHGPSERAARRVGPVLMQAVACLSICSFMCDKRCGGGGSADLILSEGLHPRTPAGWMLLVAAWPLVTVDAAVWGLGKEDLLHYQCTQPRTGLASFACRKKKKKKKKKVGRRVPWVRSGVMPYTLGPGSLSRMSGGGRCFTPSWTWRVDGPAWSQREAWPEDGSRTREDFEEGTYEAVWMRSGTPRMHWRERRAATQAADDATPPALPRHRRRRWRAWEDVLAVPEGHERPPWQQAYAHLRDNTLDRGQRAFAWQLLHAALVPRAARVAHDDRLGPTEGVCTHPHCTKGIFPAK